MAEVGMAEMVAPGQGVLNVNEKTCGAVPN